MADILLTRGVSNEKEKQQQRFAYRDKAVLAEANDVTHMDVAPFLLLKTVRGKYTNT